MTLQSGTSAVPGMSPACRGMLCARPGKGFSKLEFFNFIWPKHKLFLILPPGIFCKDMTNSRNINIETFKTALKRQGLKATPQRIAVHEAMMKLGHASADMVTDEIRKAGTTKVTVASVYNILSNLALLGIYDHRMSSNNKMYFDVNTFRHLHIYDCENHEFKDIMDEELMELVEKHLRGRRFKGYKIEQIDIQLIGRPSRRRVKTAGLRTSETRQISEK